MRRAIPPEPAREPAPSGWRRCPNCASSRFFLDAPDGGTHFLRLDAEGRAWSTAETPRPLPELLPGSEECWPELFCTQCGWRGHARELTLPDDLPEGAA